MRPVNTKDSATPPPAEISWLAESLFRKESGKLVSILTGIFGFDRLQLAEDVVQDAMIRALQTWPFYGVPENPAGWLLQTARNIALDVLRREKRFADKQADISDMIESWAGDSLAKPSPRLDQEIRDGQLRLMFACCHPELPQEAQTALALRTLCGFSPQEIARAFLTSEAAISKRLVRARQRIKELQLPYEVPAGDELPPRLDAVLQILYLLFNEGYKASSGDDLVREELCREAVRLTELVAEHPMIEEPRAHALLALMLLHSARFAARLDGDGNFQRLQEQDRSTWDRKMIQRGMEELARAATGESLSPYHLQAAIAAQHCIASRFEDTNWQAILGLYDALATIDHSPVVALNRAVAVGHVHGPADGIKAVNGITDRASLKSYFLFDAVLGDLEMQMGDFAKAAVHLRRAMEFAEQSSEKDLLRKRLAECELKITSQL